MQKYIQRFSYPKCPCCGSEETAELIYGYISNEDPIWEMIRQGRKVVLAGCQIPSNPDQWSCMSCGKNFRDNDTVPKTMEHNGNDFYVRVIIEIKKNMCSSIRYDQNMLMKELGVWIDGKERNTCQGCNLNDEHYNVLKKVLRQMKHEYENTWEKPRHNDISRLAKSHYIAALISDDGYPIVTHGGFSGDSRLIRILASFTLSFKEKQVYL